MGQPDSDNLNEPSQAICDLEAAVKRARHAGVTSRLVLGVVNSTLQDVNEEISTWRPQTRRSYFKGPKPKRSVPVCGIFKCRTSTSVADTFTHGWGALNANGFWEHECPHSKTLHATHDRMIEEELLRTRRLPADPTYRRPPISTDAVGQNGACKVTIAAPQVIKGTGGTDG